MNKLDRLLNAGTAHDLDATLLKERRTFNTFLLGSIAIIFPVAITCVFTDRPYNLIICLVVILFISSLHWVARNGYYTIAKNLFFYVSLIAIVLTTYYNFSLNRFNGVENLVFPLMLASSLLFSARDHLAHAVLTISALVMLLILRRSFENLPFNEDFVIRMVLSLMVASAILILTQIYRFNEKLLLNKMQNQQDVLYALIDHVPVLMSLIGSDKRFQMVNKPFADFLNVPREKLLGLSCEEGFPKSLVAKHKNWCFEAIDKGPVSFNDDINLNNQKISFTGKYVPIKDKTGKVQFVSQHLVDISELKKVEASLQEANDAKNKLLSMLAHDIRSPLAMLSSIMQLDKSNELSKEQFLYFKDDINKKLSNLLKSLDTVLDWSRYQLDGIRTQKAAFSLQQIAQECINLHSDYARLKEIEITLNELTDELVWADPNHIRMVLKNLIHNAIKFSGKGQDINVTVTEEGKEICLIISDHGVGMDNQQLKSILSGDIQDSLSGTSGEKGNGLGLSLSLGLLKLNELQFEITSDKGEGTRIGILMPIAIHA